MKPPLLVIFENIQKFKKKKKEKKRKLQCNGNI
jgi:hypothetical protein